MSGIFKTLIDVIEYSRIYIAIGMALWATALAEILDARHSIYSNIIIFSTVLGIYTLNRRTDYEEDQINLTQTQPQVIKLLTQVGIVAIVAGAIVAIVYRPLTLTGIIWIFFVFVVYSIPLFPQSFRYQRLKEVPVMKNLAVGAGLSGMIFAVLLTSSRSNVDLAAIVLLSFVFIRILIGSIVPDVRDMEGRYFPNESRECCLNATKQSLSV